MSQNISNHSMAMVIKAEGRIICNSQNVFKLSLLVIKDCGDPISLRRGHTSLEALAQIYIDFVWLPNSFLKSHKNRTHEEKYFCIFLEYLNLSWLCLCLVLPWACLKVNWDTGDILVKKKISAKEFFPKIGSDRVVFPDPPIYQSNYIELSRNWITDPDKERNVARKVD